MHPTAWMIRNDEVSFEVVTHIYGNKDLTYVEETISSSEWLYSHTKHEEVKTAVIEFMAAYSEFHRNNKQETRADILQSRIQTLPFKFLTKIFVEKNKEAINNFLVTRKLEDLNVLLTEELNQEFLRVRYGGMYDTQQSSRDIYFRVSSAGFNWFNIIYKFVYSYKNIIDTVTICSDEESTGVLKYYKHDGVFNHMPIDEFVVQPGSPIVESKTDRISIGNSIQNSFVRMNASRLNHKYIESKFHEYSSDEWINII